MCLGPYMFLKAVVLRNSMLVGTLLSNSEAWYNVTEVELNQLEQVDKSLWCNLTEVAKTIPYDLLCLELGLEPLRYIVMRRRLIYLQHILKRKENALIKKFIKTQMKKPQKKDWINTIFMNLNELEILLTLEEIELMPIATFKKLVKLKIKEKAFIYLIN